eukprot:353108-Chlamydomonas_euryale.AAC.6
MNSATVTCAERRTALRWRSGTLWNNKLAARTNHGGSDVCPLCMHPDCGMHKASGCTHPTIQKIYTERHNKVGRCVLTSVHKGDIGAHLKYADVGNERNCMEDQPDQGALVRWGPGLAPTQVYRQRANRRKQMHYNPTRCSPAHTRCFYGSTRLHHPSGTKTLPRYRSTETAGGGASITRGATEATGSCRGGQLTTQVSIVPILIGVRGTIFKANTINARRQLGLSSSRAMACAQKLYTIMIKQLHTTVTTRRWLEHNQPG